MTPALLVSSTRSEASRPRTVGSKRQRTGVLSAPGKNLATSVLSAVGDIAPAWAPSTNSSARTIWPPGLGSTPQPLQPSSLAPAAAKPASGKAVIRRPDTSASGPATT